MHDAHDFLRALTTVLCVAAVTTVVFQRLRAPVVLGYILAGFIVGPHIPIPLVANRDIIQTLSELGVILLMFSLGLEFSLRKLVQVGPTAGITAVIQSSLMVLLGYMVGQAFGWTSRESLFTGAIIAISSTTIIAKAFEEQGVQGKLRELVVGVLIVEDLIAILLMTLLTALSSGDGLSLGTLAKSSGRLALFLAGLVLAGMFLVPRTVRYVNRLKRPETTLVANIGLCFGVALLAHWFGYSVALGAFIAGSLVAESGEEKVVEHLILPVRDMFAAIFFVSVGMLIDPKVIAEHWFAVSVLTLVVIVGKLVGVSIGAFLSGSGVRTSVQAGMSLAQIGEFSFIIAGLGVTLHATRGFLYPIAVAVSAITTLTTPWLIRAAGPVASLVDRKLPKPLQTFTALYGSWIEQMRHSGQKQTRAAASYARRLLRLLALDVGLLAVLVIATAVFLPALADQVVAKLSVPAKVGRNLVLLGAGVVAIPFCLGIIRISRALGVQLAKAALPESGDGKVDLAAAPRRAFIVTFQLAIVLLVGIPMLALLQPFLPTWVAIASLGSLIVILSFFFWRSAANLHGHVRAGAEVIVEALVNHVRRHSAPVHNHDGQAGTGHVDALADVKELLPGLGEPMPLRLLPEHRAVGMSLAEMNIRGLTGASVLAIARGQTGVIVPTADEILRTDDVLAIAGTHDAVDAAIALLKNGPARPSESPDAAVPHGEAVSPELPSAGEPPEGSAPPSP